MDVRRAKSRPCRIGFLLIDGFALMSWAAAVEPLRAANQLAGRKLYDIRNIPCEGASSTASCGAMVRAGAHVGEQVDFDILFVVAGSRSSCFSEQRVTQWLRLLSRRGVSLGGISAGPVLLARAGLMDGRRMTVHWDHALELGEQFPSLMIERARFVIDRDRLTCAGGIAALDMMHALITSRQGSAFAREVSDWFMHTDVRAEGGAQRARLVQRYGITSEPILLAVEAMENNIAEPLSLRQLAQIGGVGARQLNRLFHDRLGVSTMEFYRNLRLEKAHHLLGRSVLPITQIALATGFAGSAHFSQSFRARYGTAPSSLRRRA